MSDLRTGTVTFLMTDIEGSTALWERDPSVAGEVIRRHDALFAKIVPELGGSLIRSRGEGDSIFCVFGSAPDAAACAWRLQEKLAAERWPGGEDVRVRMAIHTGEADHRAGEYYGQAVNRCARIRAAASGGQIVVSQSTQLLVRQALPAGAVLVDLGNHRLKDLLMPERLFELQVAENPRHFPALRSLNLLPHNLPHQLTSFIGRESELRDVRSLLAAHRLVTIVGLGGSGKTRLALQVGAEMLEQFPGGVWLAELATARDDRLLNRAVAEALSLEHDDADRVAESIRTGFEGQPLLMILDNCEQIADQTCAMVQRLLSACPTLTVVATSREPLRAAGEWVYQIPPLAVPGPDASNEEIIESEAVRLFSDRASAIDSSFRLTGENAPAIAEICRRLAGIPLAIEQVASNVALLSPKQILARWKEGFPALSSDARATVERHETLRACFDWSYAMLSSEQQELFRSLAVFVGGFSLEAVEEVCGGSGVASLLRDLVRKSLVVIDEQPGAERRYRYLEPVRQYAEEKLGRDEGLCALHFDWCLGLAREADPQLAGAEQAAWLEILDREHDNLRAALRWAKSEGDSRVLDLACSLRRFWYWRGHLEEGKAWLSDAIEVSQAQDEELEAKVFNVIGAIANKLGQGLEARAAYEKSLRLWRELGDAGNQAAVGHNIGILLSEDGLYVEALDHFSASLSAYRELGNAYGIASSLLNLGVCETANGAPEIAIPLLREALEIFEAESNAALAANAHANLAVSFHKQGDTSLALDHLAKAFDICRDVKDRVEIAGGLLELASILADLRQWREAAIVVSSSEAIRSKIGGVVGAAHRKRLDGLSAIKDALNEGEFKQLVRQGKSMSITAAVEYALGLCGQLQNTSKATLQ